MKLLFEFATWHALAKLRLHSESTLSELETSTERLGSLLRKFKHDVCSAYHTRDLPSEEAARGKREARQAAKKSQTESATQSTTSNPAGVGKPTKKTATKFPEFNMETYKMHSLGDYLTTIRGFGTIDNTSSQAVSTINQKDKNIKHGLIF